MDVLSCFVGLLVSIFLNMFTCVIPCNIYFYVVFPRPPFSTYPKWTGVSNKIDSGLVVLKKNRFDAFIISSWQDPGVLLGPNRFPKIKFLKAYLNIFKFLQIPFTKAVRS